MPLQRNLLTKMSNKNCVFCSIDSADYVAENPLAFSVFDKQPVTKGHMLIIPKRHVKDFFEITRAEHDAIYSLLLDMKAMLDLDFSPDGYNIGVNCGVPAGQSVMHVLVHLIPRYTGDTDSPRGGVRGVIPCKAAY